MPLDDEGAELAADFIIRAEGESLDVHAQAIAIGMNPGHDVESLGSAQVRGNFRLYKFAVSGSPDFYVLAGDETYYGAWDTVDSVATMLARLFD